MGDCEWCVLRFWFAREKHVDIVQVPLDSSLGIYKPGVCANLNVKNFNISIVVQRKYSKRDPGFLYASKTREGRIGCF